MGLRAACHRRGEEDREVHHPWAVHAEDKGQACQEGWYFYSLWQDNQSEGSSRHKDCEGVLCQSSERQHLKSSSTSDQFWALLSMRRQGVPQLNVLAWLSSGCGDIYVLRAPWPLIVSVLWSTQDEGCKFPSFKKKKKKKKKILRVGSTA